MMQTILTVRLPLRTGLIAGLLLVSALFAAVLLAPVRAQETPTPTPEEEEPVVEPTLLRVDLPDEVIAVGEEFTVELLAENVEHLAGFNLTLEYDAQVMSYVSATELGQFITSAGRQVACDAPAAGEDSVAISCAPSGPPLCLGGAAGASGAGLLAQLTFRGDAASAPVLSLTESAMLLDDVDPCGAGQLLAVEIPHETENAGPALVRPGHAVQEEPASIEIVIAAEEEPVPKGDVFEAQVMVGDVENLAGFDFTIQFDPDRLEPVEGEAPQDGEGQPTPAGDLGAVQVLDIGEFLRTSGERPDVICTSSTPAEDTLAVGCATTYAPFCLGGPAGASGSGVLGRVLFTSKGGGTAKLEFSDTKLALDDVEPCGPDATADEIRELRVVEIPHRAEGASVELVGGGTSWLLWGLVIGAVVVVAAGGVAGFMWYRGRTGTA